MRKFFILITLNKFKVIAVAFKRHTGFRRAMRRANFQILVRLLVEIGITTTLVGSALFFTGCTVGPNYISPNNALPARWENAHTPSSVYATKRDVSWWKHFHDPVLEQVITEAERANLDIKIAKERIAEARAETAATRSSLFPTVNAAGSATREANQFAVPGDFPGMTKPFNIFQGGFDASWEIDLFGGKRRALEAAKAEQSAMELSAEDVRISLVAEVARSYITIRHHQAQLSILEKSIADTQRVVAITEAQFKAGAVPHNDVTTAKAELKQAEMQLPLTRNQLAQAEYSLDVLLAKQPGTAHRMLAKPAPVPLAEEAVVVAAPASVIAARPDIQRAERLLASTTAKQGVALAERFPRLSLSGFMGVLSTDSGHLLTYENRSWQVGSNILFPLLNYGAITRDINTANHEQQIALMQYQKTVLAALADVEQALNRYSAEEVARTDCGEIEHSRHSSAEVAALRYKEGMDSFLTVLDAQRSLHTAQSACATARANTATALVALYKSLGGGWK